MRRVKYKGFKHDSYRSITELFDKVSEFATEKGNNLINIAGHGDFYRECSSYFGRVIVWYWEDDETDEKSHEEYAIEFISPFFPSENHEFELRRITCTDENGKIITYKTKEEAQVVCDNKNLVIDELKKRGYAYYAGFSVKKLEKNNG